MLPLLISRAKEGRVIEPWYKAWQISTKVKENCGASDLPSPNNNRNIPMSPLCPHRSPSASDTTAIADSYHLNLSVNVSSLSSDENCPSLCPALKTYHQPRSNCQSNIATGRTARRRAIPQIVLELHSILSSLQSRSPLTVII